MSFCAYERIPLGADVEQARADFALQVNSSTKGFDGKPLFRDASLSIGCGECVALAGSNGSGKTTFLCEAVEKGRWEELDKRIETLSGGEKNRLQLARIMMLKANFLILDEPTNHMDIVSGEAIEESLAAFTGTVLVVSHDRYFLDKIATTIVQIEDCAFRPYPGSFTEFWARRDGRVAGPDAKRVAELDRRITEHVAGKRQLETDITVAFSLYERWEATAG